LLSDWPDVFLSESEAARFLTGLRRRTPLADAQQVRVYGPLPPAVASQEDVQHPARVLLGSAHIKAGELIPTRLLSPAEVQGLVLMQMPIQPAEVHAPTIAQPQPDPVL